mmetsp:Transcript_4122/g.8825  ORF Transcript_4122/g.8825 Transcript_4122/m.8825 type:complete len:200 (-) Transcript_4122:1557-2156(-)
MSGEARGDGAEDDSGAREEKALPERLLKVVRVEAHGIAKKQRGEERVEQHVPVDCIPKIARQLQRRNDRNVLSRTHTLVRGEEQKKEIVDNAQHQHRHRVRHAVRVTREIPLHRRAEKDRHERKDHGDEVVVVLTRRRCIDLDLSQVFELRRRQLDRVLEHVPRHRLAAGRGRQTARVRVKFGGVVLRQQLGQLETPGA